MIEKIEHHARIELPATRAHGQTVQRRETHGRRHAPAVLDPAHGCAGAEMRDHGTPRGCVRCSLLKLARNVLVGQPVEPVAADALLVIDAGQGECVVDPGVGAMERRIETGDLHRIRKGPLRGLYAGQVMRLVQRRERNKLFQLRDNLAGYPQRLGIARPAMHDAVPDGLDRHRREVRLERIEDVLQGRFMRMRRTFRSRPVLKLIAGIRAQDEMRRRPQRLDLPLGEQPGTLPLRLEQRKFQRGGACVKRQEMWRHAASRCALARECCQAR